MTGIRTGEMARTGRATRAGRRFGASLALFALLLQVALPLQYPTMSAAMLAFGAAGGPSLHPAAAQPDHAALKVGKHHATGGKENGAGHDKPACPVCQALQHFAAFLAPPGPAVLASVRPAATPAASVPNPFCESASSVPQPRAPPMTA